jgi:hypothetical protein
VCINCLQIAGVHLMVWGAVFLHAVDTSINFGSNYRKKGIVRESTAGNGPAACLYIYMFAMCNGL